MIVDGAAAAQFLTIEKLGGTGLLLYIIHMLIGLLKTKKAAAAEASGVPASTQQKIVEILGGITEILKDIKRDTEKIHKAQNLLDIRGADLNSGQTSLSHGLEMQGMKLEAVKEEVTKGLKGVKKGLGDQVVQLKTDMVAKIDEVKTSFQAKTG